MAKMGRPKSDNPKSEQIVVRLEKHLYDEFTNECKKENVEKSTKIRKWIVMFLESKKK